MGNSRKAQTKYKLIINYSLDTKIDSQNVIAKNLPGQALELHVLYFSSEPVQDPPLLSDTVLYLVYFWRPPSQLLEHDPLADQFDHWQLTGEVVEDPMEQ